MSELRTIMRHAGTVLAGQLAVMAFGVTDTLVAGRFSSEALAALSVGSAIYISIFIALNGVLQAQLPVWAELRGAGHDAEVGRAVRQALYLAFMVMVLGVAALLMPGPLMRWTQVPPALQAEVKAYLAILALAAPPALLFRMYATLNQSLGWPRLVTWVQIGSLALKVPLSVWLTFGGLGVPAMGLAGCAWATVIVTFLMFGLACWMLGTQPMYQPYCIWQRLERPDWHAIGRVARLGIPTRLAVLVAPAHWRVETYLEEQDLERVQVGDGGHFYPEAPGQPFVEPEPLSGLGPYRHHLLASDGHRLPFPHLGE